MWNTDHKPELSGSLLCDHFDVGSSVTVETEDGARCWFSHAFWRPEGDFYVVYTEHDGYFVFFRSSVIHISGQKWREE